MPCSPRRPRRALFIPYLVVFLFPCGAADPFTWDAPPFTLDPRLVASASAGVRTPEGEDAVFLFEEDVYRFETSGGVVHSYRVIYRILSQAGLARWSVISGRWQPWRQEKPSINARVVGGDGSVSILDAASLSGNPSPQGGSFACTDMRTMRAPLPNVGIGSVVELETDTVERSPVPGAGSLWRVPFSHSAPILTRRLVLDFPAGMPVRYLVRGGGVEVRREERDGRCRVRFDAASIPAGKVLETDLPPDVSPYITVDFSTGESWNGVARGFTAIALPSAGGGALKDYVAAAVGRENAASGPGERKALIQRILLRIQQDVRFASASPAENAIVPRPPLETLRRGCGDCKDLAALLVACLSEAGIEARLALLMSGNGTDVPACLPGFGLFSHVIAYVPEYDTWIDPTATFYRPGDLPPGDQGRSALVISPDTASLAVTPESAPEDNLLRQVTELRLSERGHADVEETRTASGSIEASYRKQFDGQDPADRRRQVEQLSRNAYQTTDVAGIEIADPRDLERRFSVWFSARGARTGFTDGTRTTVEIKPGSLLEFLPSCITRAQQAGEALCRAQDLYLSLPFVYEHEYRIHPAPGFHAAPLPEDQVLHIGPAVFSSHLTSLADGTVLARIRFDTVKRRFTPAEADALRAGALRLLQAPPIRVTFGRAGESLTAGE